MDMIREGYVTTLTTMKNIVNWFVSFSKVYDAKKLVEKIKTKFPKNSDKCYELEKGCLINLEYCYLPSLCNSSVIWGVPFY